MSVTVEVKNAAKVVAKLRQKALEQSSTSVVVGYTAKYALWVHENRAMKWRGFPRDRSIRKEGDFAITGHNASKKKGLFWGPRGRAGFLLDVMRELKDELTRIIHKAMAKKVTLGKALLLAGLRLQRESQLNVPVELGNLRASAFTRLE